MVFPVAAIDACFFSLPVPLVRGGHAFGLEGIRDSFLFVPVGVFMFGWPILLIMGMDFCVAVASY